jgi:hypothetical protein
MSDIEVEEDIFGRGRGRCPVKGVRRGYRLSAMLLKFKGAVGGGLGGVDVKAIGLQTVQCDSP